MNTAIIGHGEIGLSLERVYNSKNIEVMIRDISFNSIDKSVDVLNICIPGGLENFIELTNSYIFEYTPKLTIIHSTVPVGTTRKIEGPVVHSPVRGIHPNLKEGIETFDKFIGSNNIKYSDLCQQHFTELGLSYKTYENTETTELAKILSTTYYGLCIAWHGEMKKICDNYNVDFKAINDWTETYNKGYMELGKPQFVRPNLYPPEEKIGGHCVIPNAILLSKDVESIALDLVLKYS